MAEARDRLERAPQHSPPTDAVKVWYSTRQPHVSVRLNIQFRDCYWILGIGMAEEHSSVMVTPAPAVGLKRSGPASTVSLRKRVHDYINKEIAAGEEEGAGFITPQKKLLNSIEMVEKIVTSEIKRMQSTPRAKREERETVVKHLVSLR
ncbi:unnamed protein product [Brassica oleracea var. botrytis]